MELTHLLSLCLLLTILTGVSPWLVQSNSQSIHWTLQEVKEQLHQLKTEGTDWLKNLMDEWGISGW